MKNKLAKCRVYLCGAVERKVEQEWRTRITKLCENRFHMTVYNPLIKPCWMPIISGKTQQKMYEELINGDQRQVTNAMIKSKNNMTRMYCLALSRSADIIVLHYDHRAHTVGTFEEITSNSHKPIFVLAEKKKVSMWLIDQLDLYSAVNRNVYLHFSLDSLGAALDAINRGDIDVKFDPFKWIFLTHGG